MLAVEVTLAVKPRRPNKAAQADEATLAEQAAQADEAMLPVGATLARETLRPPRSLCDSTRCATKRNTGVQAAVTS
eukprot:461913-Heterocapsa_arctica.AAC.1